MGLDTASSPCYPCTTTCHVVSEKAHTSWAVPLPHLFLDPSFLSLLHAPCTILT